MTRFVKLYGTVRLWLVRYGPYLLKCGVLPLIVTPYFTITTVRSLSLWATAKKVPGGAQHTNFTSFTKNFKSLSKFQLHLNHPIPPSVTAMNSAAIVFPAIPGGLHLQPAHPGPSCAASESG
jgi:hypothetical protein